MKDSGSVFVHKKNPEGLGWGLRYHGRWSPHASEWRCALWILLLLPPPLPRSYVFDMVSYGRAWTVLICRTQSKGTGPCRHITRRLQNNRWTWKDTAKPERALVSDKCRVVAGWAHCRHDKYTVGLEPKMCTHLEKLGNIRFTLQALWGRTYQTITYHVALISLFPLCSSNVSSSAVTTKSQSPKVLLSTGIPLSYTHCPNVLLLKALHTMIRVRLNAMWQQTKCNVMFDCMLFDGFFWKAQTHCSVAGVDRL